ncbi:c-type cytochrome [Fimbriiglobus ruber]|uniref:Putative cytochrome oxidase (Cbb3-type) n=1 Tax=Fimbriiglobus ruber TaxID=1908690 RepID=A0A225DGE4_9BACT|nr:hypothetical protein [Fimbriiglobus ruber]OWK38734.1 putative cytochrome oxidase (cbb3-type) [Fimbriiglobus ruber]
MKSFGLPLVLWVLGLSLPSASAGPVIPGLADKHPLSEAEAGRLLLGELKCAACHASPPSALPDRAAPDLAEVGARVAPEYLKRFLASPEAAHPGSTMPDVLASEPAEERAKIAEALAHFLITQSPKKFDPRPADPKNAPAGKALFHSVGCVTCHPPRDNAGKERPRDGAVGLGHVPAKYGAAALADFLYQPHRVRSSGRMPDMKLTPTEATAVAGFLLGAPGEKPAVVQTDTKLAAVGKQHFQRLNCAACHKLGDIPAGKPVAALEGSDLAHGCLSRKPGKGPRYVLDDGQVKAIRAALAAKAEPASDTARVALTLTAFNCVGCHARDKFGGVSEEIDPFFTSGEKELGDEGRLPPPLTLVGAKLRPVALKKVLFDGDGVRPYMATRMPQYGEANLRHLPDLLAKLDAVKPVAFNLPKPDGATATERDREKEMRAGGRELVGDKGLGCVACHTFNGKAAGKKGIELLTTTERLRPSWYFHFLQNPGAFRPRVVMPSAWPNGVAVHTTILAGDTHRQLEAVWYYLSLGTSAQDPSGVQNPETLLSATDAARTYRGRSGVAGYRGIAVGSPERLHYAFNAETGTLSAIWTGDFVRVNRGGQGSGNFHPAGRFVQLAQDVSFHDLADERAPWPLRPVMTKEVPANPNPLYPKNLGYQFQGYHTDDASIPTFMYLCGEIEIEDRSVVQLVDKKPRLVRTLAFDSPKDRTVWFRALTGKIAAESETQFKTGELRVTAAPAGPTVLRPTADAKANELLLKFAIPKGKSTKVITYELLP